MKITRDAFLYLDPKAPKDAFAQCATCALYVAGAERCAILGPAQVVLPGDSCGLYVPGSPNPDLDTKALVTPEEAGLVHRQVRCENCVYLKAEGCDLYWQLNKALPDVFDLDNDVDPQGCCNAQTPSGTEKTVMALDAKSFAEVLLGTKTAAVKGKGKPTTLALITAEGDDAPDLAKAGARHGKTDKGYVQDAHDACMKLVDGAHCSTTTKAAAAAALTKAGARHSAVDLERIQKAHNLIGELGALCPTALDPAPDPKEDD